MSETQNKYMRVEVLHQVKLILALVICMAIALSIILWAKAPQMRPLIDDLRVVEAVKVVDVLNQHRIPYQIELAHHMLYVAEEHSQLARVALARVGIVIEYPEYLGPIARRNSTEVVNPVPVYQQPWFMKIARLFFAALVLIVFIIIIMRPLLRCLIYPEDIEIVDQENEKL